MASEEKIPLQLRIALIGKVGVGKTSVMKTLLMSSEVISDTEKCQKKEAKIGGQTVVVVDTPGLSKTDEEVVKEIIQCVSLTDPGPHVFLFVLNVDDTFTPEDRDAVEIFKKTFGKKAASYTMALFTHGDTLKNEGITIQTFVEENGDLRSFVDTCKGGLHVIDNNDITQSEATELLEKINNMAKENGQKCYTVEMLKEAEKENSGVWKRIALSVNGSALAGAGLGGVVTHFVGSAVGIPVGAAAGAAVGGVLGGVGIVTAEWYKYLNSKSQSQTNK